MEPITITCDPEVVRMLEAYAARQDISLDDADNHALQILGLMDAYEAAGGIVGYVTSTEIDDLLAYWGLGHTFTPLELHKLQPARSGLAMAYYLRTIPKAYDACMAYHRVHNTDVSLAFARGVLLLCLFEREELMVLDDGELVRFRAAFE